MTINLGNGSSPATPTQLAAIRTDLGLTAALEARVPLSIESQTALASLAYVNVGTVAAPIWEISANLIPRSDTLAGLMALASGGGELASANDVPAIVQLYGPASLGSAYVYSPMASGVWSDTTFTLTSGAVKDGVSPANALYIRGGTSTTAAATGGAVNIVGGAAGSSTGNGGTVTVSGGTAGASGTAGNVILRPGAGGGRNQGRAGTLTITDSASNVVFKVGATESTLSFFGVAPVVKQIVSGSVAGNVALASLITALATLGLVADATTA